MSLAAVGRTHGVEIVPAQKFMDALWGRAIVE